jgi:predicted house-cleaning NTP pyrophosphatase (Maf/HAM1 superfamily)
MFTRIFGKPKEQANALATLDKLNEVAFIFLSLINSF